MLLVYLDLKILNMKGVFCWNFEIKNWGGYRFPARKPKSDLYTEWSFMHPNPPWGTQIRAHQNHTILIHTGVAQQRWLTQ